MGIKIEIGEILTSLIIYYLVLSVCCDISLINCDIHEMRRNQQFEGSTADISTKIAVDEFKINATELEAHIMIGLNMSSKPDANTASISQQEYFTKYNEYLSKVNYRKRRSAKFFGDDVTSFVYGDETEAVKKIFAFKHSNQSNRSRSQRKRRSTNEEDITSLDFEIANKDELPTEIEESILNVFLTNDQNQAMDKPLKADSQVNDSDSDYDDSSSLDVATTKLTLKSHRNKRKSHPHTRHHAMHKPNHISNRSKVNIITSKQQLRLHIYQTNAHGRSFLFSKDITLPINSDNMKFTYKKWIPLDLTSVVRSWLHETNEQMLSIDVYCELCSKYDMKIVSNHETKDELNHNPTLNIVGSIIPRIKRKAGHRKQGTLDEAKNYMSQPKKTFCRQDGEKKCCRHKWMIDFKELGGYDFIIQPRHFDAGFCDGTCPFRYNIGNNHAYFQSLARQKNSDVPNVCCAPTRLVDMEILHIDEKDHTRLKVTTMKKMRVMKCSCT